MGNQKASITGGSKGIGSGIVRKLASLHYDIMFSYGRHEIERVLEEEPYYSREVKSRVREILLQQRRKYQYLFA